MILAAVLGFGMLQATASSLPPSASVAVHEAVTGVEEALAKRDFAEARNRAELLPKHEFTIQWDDSEVPAGEKEDFAQMRDLAIKAWTRVFGLTPKLGADGDLLIRFASRLPNGPQNVPAAGKLDFGTHPRLVFTIGLKRGDGLEPLTAPEEYVQVARAIGSYLGLSGDPLMGSAMWLDDQPGRKPFGPTQNNFFVAQQILAVSDELRRDIASQTAVTAGEPSLSLSPSSVNVGVVRQGVMAPVEFKITNSGTTPLNYNVVPDCGCFSRVPPGSVPPGKTGTFKTVINTSVWTGNQHKGLVLYSNDPHNPAIPIPVEFTSTPAYRLYRPEGDTVIVPKGGETVDVLLTLPKDSTLLPATYEVTGVPAKVTMAPWSGVAADPEMGEGPMPRQGYRFQIQLPGDIPLGRMELDLAITTGDKTFPEIQYPLWLQKGIVASPDNLSMGDDVTGPIKKISFRLTRHGKPFTILGITTGPHLKATIHPILGQMEYQVDVAYDGLAPKGSFMEVVRVKTNDPAQPVIEVPLSGLIP